MKGKHNSLEYKIFYFLILLSIFICSKSFAQVYLDSTAAIEDRITDLLGRMTLEEKIRQMIQVDYPGLSVPSDIRDFNIGSLLANANAGPEGKTPLEWADLYDQFQSYALQTRLKIPLIFSIDAIHGNGSVYGATIFPHNIGMGCTRNPELVKKAAEITAQEMAATGIDWVLGPVTAVARNEKWGRTYESFSEDPDLVKELSEAAVIGFQGDTLAEFMYGIACAKHFIGDGGTTNGINAGSTVLDEQTLRAIHLPGYLSAIKQKVGSIMVSQSTWNGDPCHGSHYLLTTLLKEELGFDGIVISDFNSFMLADLTNYRSAIMKSVNAGLDMAMMSYNSGFGGVNYQTFSDTLKALVNEGAVPLARIDDAVRRILKQKFRIGLFEHPLAHRSLISQVGSQEHRQIAREAVRQSLVILKKKDGILPIPKSVKRIHLAGRHADNMGYQCGGWTITWQGSSGDIIPGTTIMEAIKQAAPEAEVTYSEDGYGADGSDIGIAVIGELPYAEVLGDGRIFLDRADVETVRNMKSLGIPVVVILISGRPIIINPILHHCDALIAAWLPGPEGEGITDVLFGDYQPSGLLSQTWPNDQTQIPINIGDDPYNPLFEYGYGITSLENSSPGAPPEVYSASTGVTTKTIEISFNKRMADPQGSTDGFSVMVGETTPVSISSISLKSDDFNTLILTLENNTERGSKYTVSYTPGNIHSYDQGQLAAFENISVYNLLDDYKYIHNLPGIIEAEEFFYSKSGVSTRNCSDEGGGKTIYYTGSGEWWTDYYVDVSQAGEYLLEYRFSSLQDTGLIALVTNGNSISILDIPVTGSWDNWQTISTHVVLTEGPQVIRMHAIQGGFRLNWIQLSAITDVNNDKAIIEGFQLLQNYPNPFNPHTSIEYEMNNNGHVILEIYDICGQKIKTLINDYNTRGRHKIIWDGKNDSGTKASSGVYFFHLVFGNQRQVRKGILLN
jgi:beta-glucosidase